MCVILVIKPKKANAGETLVKDDVEIDDDALPFEGTSFRIAELSTELDVHKVLTENVPKPEVHFRHTLTVIEAHSLKSQGWKRI